MQEPGEHCLAANLKTDKQETIYWLLSPALHLFLLSLLQKTAPRVCIPKGWFKEIWVISKLGAGMGWDIFPLVDILFSKTN